MARMGVCLLVVLVAACLLDGVSAMSVERMVRRHHRRHGHHAHTRVGEPSKLGLVFKDAGCGGNFVEIDEGSGQSYCVESTADNGGCESLFKSGVPKYGFDKPDTVDICVQVLEAGKSEPLYYSRYNIKLRRPLWVAFVTSKAITTQPKVKADSRKQIWFATMPGVENPVPAPRAVVDAGAGPDIRDATPAALGVRMGQVYDAVSPLIESIAADVQDQYPEFYMSRDEFLSEMQDMYGRGTLQTYLKKSLAEFIKKKNEVWNAVKPLALPKVVGGNYDGGSLTDVVTAAYAVITCQPAWRAKLGKFYKDLSDEISEDTVKQTIKIFKDPVKSQNDFEESMCIQRKPSALIQARAALVAKTENGLAENSLNNLVFINFFEWNDQNPAPVTATKGDAISYLNRGDVMNSLVNKYNRLPALNYGEDISRGHLMSYKMAGGKANLRGKATFGMINMAINFHKFDDGPWNTNVEQGVLDEVGSDDSKYYVLVGTSGDDIDPSGDDQQALDVNFLRRLMRRGYNRADYPDPGTVSDVFAIPEYLFAALQHETDATKERYWYCHQSLVDCTPANDCYCSELNEDDLAVSGNAFTKTQLKQKLYEQDNVLFLHK